MMGIPDPRKLVEIAHSAERLIQDREWKQYQRYISKYEHQHNEDPYSMPYSFEEFCVIRRERVKYLSLEID